MLSGEWYFMVCGGFGIFPRCRDHPNKMILKAGAVLICIDMMYPSPMYSRRIFHCLICGYVVVVTVYLVLIVGL